VTDSPAVYERGSSELEAGVQGQQVLGHMNCAHCGSSVSQALEDATSGTAECGVQWRALLIF
jgi:hypothetical protein